MYSTRRASPWMRSLPSRGPTTTAVRGRFAAGASFTSASTLKSVMLDLGSSGSVSQAWRLPFCPPT